MSGEYSAYVTALREVEDVALRAAAAKRAAAEANAAELARIDQVSASMRELLSRVDTQSDAAARQLAELPITVPSATPHDRQSTSDPAALSAQLVERAGGLIQECRQDVEAIARQRKRVTEVRATLDTKRRRLAEERVADMAAAEGEAARGDRVAYQAIGAGAVASLIAGAVAPAGSAAVVAVVLAAVALVVVGSRLTTFGARIETRRSGRPHDDPRTSSPPSGAALSAVFGLISAVDGAAAAIGGLGGGKPLNVLLGGSFTAVALLFAVLTTTRRK